MVYANLWEKRLDIHMETSIKSYLYTSVYNRSMNYIRDNKKFIASDLPQSVDALNSHMESPDFMEAEELEDRILTTLQQLPESCRKIFMMSRFENKKYKEISEDLGISIKTVETQMSKALKILREKLSGYLETFVLLGTLLINWILRSG